MLYRLLFPLGDAGPEFLLAVERVDCMPIDKHVRVGILEPENDVVVARGYGVSCEDEPVSQPQGAKCLSLQEVSPEPVGAAQLSEPLRVVRIGGRQVTLCQFGVHLVKRELSRGNRCRGAYQEAVAFSDDVPSCVLAVQEICVPVEQHLCHVFGDAGGVPCVG